MPPEDAVSFKGTPRRRRQADPSLLQEHALAKLTGTVSLDDGRLLPKGATGAIVGVWRNGAAYEVEFQKPFAAVLTIVAARLEPA